MQKSPSEIEYVIQGTWPGPDSRELQPLAGTLSRMGLGILHKIPYQVPKSYDYVLREIAHRNALEHRKDDTQGCEPRSNWKAIEVQYVAKALQLSTTGEVKAGSADSDKLQFLFWETCHHKCGFQVSSAKDPEFKAILCLVAAFHRRWAAGSNRATASLVKVTWDSYQGIKTNWASMICSWIKASCERVRWGTTSFVLPILFAMYEGKGWLSVSERQWCFAAKEKILKCSEQFPSPRVSPRLDKKRKRVNYNEKSGESYEPSAEELASVFDVDQELPPSPGDEAADDLVAAVQDRVLDQCRGGGQDHPLRGIDNSFVVDSHARNGASISATTEQEEFGIPQDQPERFAQEQPEEQMEKSFVDDSHWQAKYNTAMAQNAQLCGQAQFRREMYKSMCEKFEDWLAQKTIEVTSLREVQESTDAEMMLLCAENKRLIVERTVLREEQAKMGEEMRLLREEHAETKKKLETSNRELCKVRQRMTMAEQYLRDMMQDGGEISDEQSENEDRSS